MSNPYVPGQGIFLRDYFAGQAMKVAIGMVDGFTVSQMANHATYCYVVADAMLAARYGQQPPATLNGFKGGDTVELIAGPTNGIHVASVVGMNTGDPSRPKITVQANDAKGRLVGRPYDTDPELWKLFESPVGQYRTPAGRIVQLVNTIAQTPGCFIADDGKTVAHINPGGSVCDAEEPFDVDASGLVPNLWPLPQNALANVDTYLAAREAAKRRRDEPIGDGFDRDIDVTGDAQADKLVAAVGANGDRMP